MRERERERGRGGEMERGGELKLRTECSRPHHMMVCCNFKILRRALSGAGLSLKEGGVRVEE